LLYFYLLLQLQKAQDYLKKLLTEFFLSKALDIENQRNP
jgi:hypothetical protein